MKIPNKILAMFFAPVFLLSLAACEQQGPAEEAGEAIDDAVDEAGDAVEEAGDAVEDATSGN